MQQFYLGNEGAERQSEMLGREKKRRRGAELLLLFYLLLGEIDLRDPCLSSLSDNETRDETEKDEIQQSTRQENNNLPW